MTTAAAAATMTGTDTPPTLVRRDRGRPRKPVTAPPLPPPLNPPAAVRLWERIDAALALGFACPACRIHGFALVRGSHAFGTGDDFRAARLDAPFAAGERALAHYLYSVCTGRWTVYAPPLMHSGAVLTVLKGRMTEKGTWG